MNLIEMRRAIANRTDLDPEESSYLDQMTLLLNTAYEEVWGEAVWDFAQRLSYLPMYPDLSSERNGDSLVTTNDGSRVVTFSVAIPVLTFKKDIWEGNVVEIQGREYTILQVNSTTELVTTEPIRHPAVAGVSPVTVTGQTDWKIKARYYTLPEDCVQILSLAHRDAPVPGSAQGYRQKIWGLANRVEEVAGFDQDRTQDFAEFYVPIPPTVVPPAEELSQASTNVAADVNGTFRHGYYFEFCWCFMSPDGTLGPLSKPDVQIVSTDVGNPTYNAYITLSFTSYDGILMANRAVSYATRGAPEPLEGLRKRVFFNANFNRKTGERLGEPKWLSVTNGLAAPSDTTSNANDPVIALDSESQIDLLYESGLHPGNPEYQEWDGSHKRIRPWPRVDAYDQQYSDNVVAATRPVAGEDYFRRAELRYLAKPRRLRYDTDTPALPWQMHQIIVNKALIQVYLKSNNLSLASYYEKLVDKQMRKFKARYLSKEDFTWQRGRFNMGDQRSFLGNRDYNVTLES